MKGVIICAALLAAVGALIAGPPVTAHHSVSAEFDTTKPISFSGTIKKVEWTNPHTHFYVDVKNPDGTVKTWNFEMASTLALERAGWTRKTLPVGTEVTIGGFGGRAVTERAIAAKMVTADGKELFVGKPGQ
jgi:hypothetical protein